MSYDTEGLGFSGHRGGQLHHDGRGGRDMEEEPSELDAPESDGLDNDELEDDELEAASPLAEDMLTTGQEEVEGFAASTAAADDDSDDIDSAADVRASGGSEGLNMTQDERRREFPTAKESAKAASAKNGGEPRVTKRRGRKKIARA